jgi:hypothetical protein
MNRTFAAASAFLFVFLICSVSACDAADHPGHDDALAQIKPHILGSKYGTISNLRYVNGYPKGAVYIVAASWTITFPKSYEEAARADGYDLNHISDTFLAVGDAGLYATRLIYGQFTSGQSVDAQGRYQFQKTENGWVFMGPDQ